MASMTRPNLTELGIDLTKLEDFSKPEHQEEFFKLQKAAPDIAREYINLGEAEAWDENLKRHAVEHYEQYMLFDEKRTVLLLEIAQNREEFENKILPNISDDLVDSVIGLLENQHNPKLEVLLKQANFDFHALKFSKEDFQNKAKQLLDVILKTQTYEAAVEQNRDIEIVFTNFDGDPDIADVAEYLKGAFGKELLQKSLISEINNYPNTVNVRIGRDDYLLPIEVYQQWKDKMPVVKEHKYRAESFVSWNTDPNFSKKFIPLPIMVNSFYDEDPSGNPYLQSVPPQLRMKYYKLGTIAHEVGHHIYDYLMDADKRTAWKKVVDGSPVLSDYADQYSDHKLKYDEVFTEVVRLKTTVPEYLVQGFSEINKFLEENFPAIQKPNLSANLNGVQ